MLNIEDCYEQNNKVIILCEKLNLETELDKSDAWNIDSYITYRVSNHFGKSKVQGYTKYIVKERILDENNNLILVCDEQYNEVK